MQFVRGALRFVVVGFTIVSLLLVAAIGVSASQGKAGTNNLKSSVVSLFSGLSEQTTANKDNGGGGGGGEKCKPAQRHHTHATEDEDNNHCGGGGHDGGSGGRDGGRGGRDSGSG